MTFGNIFWVFSAVHPRDLGKWESQQIYSKCRRDSPQYWLKSGRNAPLWNNKMLLLQTDLKAKHTQNKLRVHRTMWSQSVCCMQRFLEPHGFRHYPHSVCDWRKLTFFFFFLNGIVPNVNRLWPKSKSSISWMWTLTFRAHVYLIDSANIECIKALQANSSSTCFFSLCTGLRDWWIQITCDI